MTLSVRKLETNVLGVDTVARLDPLKFRGLVARGFRFRGGYIDELNAIEIEQQLNCVKSGAGLPLLLYTYANEFDPAHTLDRLSDLGIPPGASIVLDVEALKPPEGSSTADVEDFVTEKIAQINAWGKGISNHAFLPCGYFGAQELLTSEELSRLWTFRYHEGASNLLDRNGKFAIPSRGYAMKQGRPCNVTFLEIGAVPFDVDFHCADYHDDVFSVVVAS